LSGHTDLLWSNPLRGNTNGQSFTLAGYFHCFDFGDVMMTTAGGLNIALEEVVYFP
jgi:hypothetical protein